MVTEPAIQRCPFSRLVSSCRSLTDPRTDDFFNYSPVGVVPRVTHPTHLASRSARDLLADLDPEQRQVAEALRGPVRVLAGAGSGKTRAITYRIAHGVAEGVYAPTE